MIEYPMVMDAMSHFLGDLHASLAHVDGHINLI